MRPASLCSHCRNNKNGATLAELGGRSAISNPDTPPSIHQVRASDSNRRQIKPTVSMASTIYKWVPGSDKQGQREEWATGQVQGQLLQVWDIHLILVYLPHWRHDQHPEDHPARVVQLFGGTRRRRSAHKMLSRELTWLPRSWRNAHTPSYPAYCSDSAAPRDHKGWKRQL